MKPDDLIEITITLKRDGQMTCKFDYDEKDMPVSITATLVQGMFVRALNDFQVSVGGKDLMKGETT